MKWELFQKGLKRAEWVGKEDGLIMEWNDESGLLLFMFYNRPTQAEILDISAGTRFEIAFKNIKDIGFFSIKFGNQDWADCSFSPNLYESKPVFETLKNGQGYALHVIFIDSSVGEIKVLRSIGLGSEFSEQFRQWGLGSLKKEISVSYYNKTVDEVLLKYPSPSDIVKDADIKWVLPHGEDEYRREEQVRYKL